MNFTSIELWERAFIDLWSIPHFFFGFVGFYFLHKIGFRNNAAFSVTIFAILWEFLEIFLKIEEALTNRFMDVLLTIFALLILIYIQKIGFKKDNILFKISTVVFIGVSVIGWFAHFSRIF